MKRRAIPRGGAVVSVKPQTTMPQLIDFTEATQTIGRPEDWEESQCAPARAFVGEVVSGPNEGRPQVVTCWQLSREEILALCDNGGRIYLSFIGGLPPHFPALSFEDCRLPL